MGFHKYSLPCERYEYNKRVGEILPKTLAVVLTNLGFKAEVNPLQANDVDQWVYRSNRLTIAAEILNWSIRSWLSNSRKRWIIRNLCRYKCERVLIHSVPNRNIDEVFAKNNIDTVCIGFQLLPIEFYEFFLQRGQVIRRKPLSTEVVEEIRCIIENYLTKAHARRTLKH